MARKNTTDIGVKINEANHYRDWQHKIFKNIATGDEFQLITFVWSEDGDLNVVLGYCILPKYKIVLGIVSFKLRYELVKT